MKKSATTPSIRASAALLLAVLIALVVACGGMDSPSMPSRTSDGGATPTSGAGAVGGQATASVEICHRTDDGRSFIAISVASSAVAAHLAHGDALVGDAVPGQPGMVFGAGCSIVPGGAVTITFSGLLVNRDAVTSYTESGFTVTATVASWVAWTGYGNPAPSIVFEAPAGAPPTMGEVRVAAGGAKFRFASVDLYSSTTKIPYVLNGLAGGSPLYSISGLVPNTFGNFATVANPHAGEAIDTLVIQLTNAPAPCCQNPMGLDNIRLVR